MAVRRRATWEQAHIEFTPTPPGMMQLGAFRPTPAGRLRPNLVNEEAEVVAYEDMGMPASGGDQSAAATGPK